MIYKHPNEKRILKESPKKMDRDREIKVGDWKKGIQLALTSQSRDQDWSGIKPTESWFEKVEK